MMFSILLVVQPETILTKLSPLLYTIIGITAFVVVIKGLFNGENIKTIIGKFMLCATLAAIAYKPTTFLSFGETILSFVTGFSGYFV